MDPQHAAVVLRYCLAAVHMLFYAVDATAVCMRMLVLVLLLVMLRQYCVRDEA